MDGTGFVIALIVAAFIYSDANQLRKLGVRLSPIIWASVVCALCLVFLPFTWSRGSQGGSGKWWRRRGYRLSR
jgi:hypothetical protein